VRAFGYRIPPPGWKPAGWSPGIIASGMITHRHAHVDVAWRTAPFVLL